MIESIVQQVKVAASPANRLALICGGLMGAFVPCATFFVAHFEIDNVRPIYFQISALLVLGGLVFSAKTVFDWTRVAFKSNAKALGFVVIAEGIMTFADSKYLAVAGLLYLIIINAVATGCTLALDYKESRKTGATKRKAGGR